MFDNIYRGLTVLVTGHTGFKGGWLSLWLNRLGAQVVGYALQPPGQPSFFEACRLDTRVTDIRNDIRDLESLKRVVDRYQPALIFHLAAQSLVRQSFVDPVGTYATNVMGTVNVLEAARGSKNTRGVIIATSDKCYRLKKEKTGYRESDPLGGNEPYSGSKACAEIVVESYRTCFFHSGRSNLLVSTIRAGNVIGGGDWGADRLVPDCIRALVTGRHLLLRYPSARRPWQHVLDALAGYLLVGSYLYQGKAQVATAWNFGPSACGVKTVSWVVKELSSQWGKRCLWKVADSPQPPESLVLKLDSRRARERLKWRPCWPLREAIRQTVLWYQQYYTGSDMYRFSTRQIEEFERRTKKWQWGNHGL